MGTFNFPEAFTCPKCGSHTVREHEKHYGGRDSEGKHRWFTREERRADPEIAAICEKAMNDFRPCMWVTDHTYSSCDNCEYELNPEEHTKVAEYVGEFWAAFMRGEVPINESIGAVIGNTKAIKKIRFDTEDSV